MPIEKITADNLRDMAHQEGLVLQGCGGEAQEWLDGINNLLTQVCSCPASVHKAAVRRGYHKNLASLCL